MCVAWHIHIYRITHWFTKLLYCIVLYIIFKESKMLYIFFFLILVHMHLSPYICSLFVIWTQCFVTVSTLYIFFLLSQCFFVFFLASHLGIVKNFLKQNLNDILSSDTLSKRYVALLLSMLWCYISTPPLVR